MLVPIAICVVMPVAIVLIIALTKINAENKRAEVLMRAIESNNVVDTDKLLAQFKKRVRTPRELLNLRLRRGFMFTLIGAIMIVLGLLAKFEGCNFAEDDVFMPMMMGGISLGAGISYLIVYFVTCNEVDNSDK